MQPMKLSEIKTRLGEIGFRKMFHFQAIAWLGTLVNLCVLWLLHGQLKVPLVLAGVIAIEVAIIHNYTWNYYVTWKTRVRHTLKDYLQLLVKYNAFTASVDFVVNLGVLWLLNRYFGTHYLLADLIGQLLGPVFKLLGNEFLIFPKAGCEQASLPEQGRLGSNHDKEES